MIRQDFMEIFAHAFPELSATPNVAELTTEVIESEEEPLKKKFKPQGALMLKVRNYVNTFGTSNRMLA